MSMPLHLRSDDAVLRNVPLNAMVHQDNMRRNHQSLRAMLATYPNACNSPQGLS